MQAEPPPANDRQDATPHSKREPPWAWEPNALHDSDRQTNAQHLPQVEEPMGDNIGATIHEWASKPRGESPTSIPPKTVDSGE